MPRPPRGSKRHTRDGWQPRITLATGKQVWLKLRLNLPEPEADQVIADLARRSRAERWTEVPERIAIPQLETVSDWFDRWIPHREAAGYSSTKTDKGRFHAHIEPMIGPLSIRAVSRADMRALVARLDERVQKAEIKRAKTAINAWALVKAMFSDAKDSKIDALVVRDDDPTEGVRGPDEGEKVSGTYLYPCEFLQLACCEAVPRRWRRIYTWAVYTYGRAGEQAAVEWPDVDFLGLKIPIRKQLHATKKKLARTKTGQKHSIPIEPALLPLLQAMHAESGGVGPVLPRDETKGMVSLPAKKAADMLRKHLLRAGVTRDDLHRKRDEFRRPITFHDLRATAATWMALRGDPLLVIADRCGHKNTATTQLYIREAERIGKGADIGEPFPALPTCLLGVAEPEPAKVPEEHPARDAAAPPPEHAENRPATQPEPSPSPAPSNAPALPCVARASRPSGKPAFAQPKPRKKVRVARGDGVPAELFRRGYRLARDFPAGTALVRFGPYAKPQNAGSGSELTPLLARP